jgi:hypothetical protein
VATPERFPTAVSATVARVTEIELPAPGIGASLRRTLALLARHRRAVAAVWAVLIAAGSVAHFEVQTASPLLQLRAEGVARSIAVLDRDGPPLLVSNGQYSPGTPAHRLTALGGGRDAGVYLYLPLLGDLTGEKDPAVLMKWLFEGCFALLVLVLPIAVFELFGSLLFAFLAPILVLWRFESIQGMDVYWVEAWCLLLCLPPLLLALRWWRSGLRRRAGVLLASLMLAAGLASGVRSGAGLAVLVDGVAVILVGDAVALPRRLRLPAGWRPGRPTRALIARLGIAAALVLAYLCPSTLAAAAAAAYRDASVHLLPAASVAPIHRPDSSVALGALVGTALHRFWLAPVLLAVGLAIPSRRREAAVAAALVAPALAIGASMLLVVPDARYALGWAGAWGVLWLLGIGWMLAELARLRSRRDLERLASTPRRPAVAVAVVAALVGAAAASGAPSPATSTESFYAANATPVPFAPQNVSTLVSWRFDERLPAGWRAANADLQADRSQDGRTGLFAKTATAGSAATLIGPPQLLPPGTYVVAESGLVLDGGIRLLVRSGRGAVLASKRFWWGQRTAAGQPLTETFRIRRQTRVRVGVDAWAPPGRPSAFVVRRLSLQHLLPPAAYYAGRATPLVPASRSNGLSSSRTWPFINGGTPQGVNPVPGLEASDASGHLGAATTDEPAGRQLLFDPIELPAGRYAFTLDGDVVRGGLALEIIDAGADARIATGRFWHSQHFDGHEMSVAVTLTRSRAVRIVLANWAPARASSRWVLEQLAILQLR